MSYAVRKQTEAIEARKAVGQSKSTPTMNKQDKSQASCTQYNYLITFTFILSSLPCRRMGHMQISERQQKDLTTKEAWAIQRWTRAPIILLREDRCCPSHLLKILIGKDCLGLGLLLRYRQPGKFLVLQVKHADLKWHHTDASVNGTFVLYWSSIRSYSFQVNILSKQR